MAFAGGAAVTLALAADHLGVLTGSGVEEGLGRALIR